MHFNKIWQILKERSTQVPNYRYPVLYYICQKDVFINYLFYLININFKRHTYAHKQFKKKFINIWIKKQINLKFNYYITIIMCVCILP